MRPSQETIIGTILIILSVLSFVAAICQIFPYYFIDFPCFDDYYTNLEFAPDTRITYCMSIEPRQALSGGGVYANGTSNEDEVEVDIFAFKREDQILYVNGHPLQPQERYNTTIWKSSINPWLIFTTRCEIWNYGLVKGKLSEPDDVLNILGFFSEGWLPNPFGLIILVGGIWLRRQGIKGKKQAALEGFQSD